MFKKGRHGIVDIIGVTLVVVAIISAGGIYYTASSYSKISDTLTSTAVFVPTVNITYSSGTGFYDLAAVITAINDSPLEIEFYEIEFNMYAFPTESRGLDFDHWVTAGGQISGGNGTVLGNSMSNLYQTIHTSSEKLSNNIVNGRTYIGFSGSALYEISDYPDVTNKLYFGYWDWVEVYVQ
jgi:hypothetical protein